MGMVFSGCGCQVFYTYNSLEAVGETTNNFCSTTLDLAQEHKHNLCSKRDEEQEVPEWELAIVPGNELNVVVMVAFFLTYQDLGRMFDNSFPICAFFFFFKN